MSINITVVSSLEKIFQNAPLPEEHVRLDLLLNGRGSLQWSVVSDADATLSVSAESPLSCRLYEVKDVPVGRAVYENARNCTVLNGGKSGDYPDLLVPCGGSVTVKAGRPAVLWTEFTGEQPGGHRIVFTASDGTGSASAESMCWASEIRLMTAWKLR